MASKDSPSAQGVLDLKVEVEKEVQGVSMGVLSDGTPFLTQRGLARLCGIENRHIATIGHEWNDPVQKGRITKIKDLLSRRGVTVDMPYVEIVQPNGREVHAHSDVVSLAILEYYAFESDTLNQNQARDNFRMLAGKALQDFIYTQVGYSPNNVIPVEWQHFHDRVLLVHNKVPAGFFSIFKEMSDIIIAMIRGGARVDEKTVPDSSVGRVWSDHWEANSFDTVYGRRGKYPHSYPDYFPQAKSNPQGAFCYPDSALGEFRRWMREVYLPTKFPSYLGRKQKQGELPPSVVTLVLSAVQEDEPKRLT
jgi:hypothetical protein